MANDLSSYATDLLETITSLSGPSDLQISPDGEHLAYVVTPYWYESDRQESSIWIVTSRGLIPPRQFTAGKGRDDTPRWSPDGRSLTFLSDRLDRGVKSLYRISLSGGEATPLVKRNKTSIETFEWSPDGSQIAFTAVDEPTEADARRERERDDPEIRGERRKNAHLHVLDVAQRTIRVLETGDVHVVEFAWAPDGKRLAYFAAPTPELEARNQLSLFVISVEGPWSKRVCSAATCCHLNWRGPSPAILYVGPHDGKPQAALTVFAVDLELLVGGREPSEDLKDSTPRVVGPTRQEGTCAVELRKVQGTQHFVVSVAHGLTTRLEWLDAVTEGRETFYAFGEGDIHGFAVGTRDGAPLLAVIQSAGNVPPEVHFGRPSALPRVSSHHTPLMRFSFGTQEQFFWKASDGLVLDGVVIRPPTTAAGPWPTVVLIHGGPYAGRSGNGFHMVWAQWLAMQGYAVLLPNYRGGIGHGHDFAVAIRGDVGGRDFLDIMTAVDAAVDRGIADPDRLGIGGWSQGGFAAAWAITQTHRFKAAIMGAGVSHWGMEVLTGDLPTFESILAGSRPWDGPGPHRGDLRSPISYAKNVRTPLLILHGKEDERIPVSQAVGFERALRENGVPVQLVTYPREPHGIRERNHERDLLRRVLMWFDQWVKECQRKAPSE